MVHGSARDEAASERPVDDVSGERGYGIIFIIYVYRAWDSLFA